MQLYTKGKNSLYWSMVGKLSANIHNKDVSVIPYMPDTEFLFVDFWPNLYPTPGAVDVYINDVFYQTCNVVDIIGTIYFTKKFSYGQTTITLKIGDSQIASSKFFAINEYMYYEAQSSDELDRLIEKMRLKGDLSFSSARDENLYDNFGSMMKTIKPSDVSYPDYRKRLSNDIDAFMTGSTVNAIVAAVYGITGQDPLILSNGDPWIVRRFNKWVTTGGISVARASVSEQLVRKQSAIHPTIDNFEFNHAANDSWRLPVANYATTGATKKYIGTVDFNFTNNKEVTWGTNRPADGYYYTLEYVTADNVTQQHKYAISKTDSSTKVRATPPIRVYSKKQANFTIRLQVNNSTRAISSESITKNFSVGGRDLLKNRHLTAATVTISGFTELVDFTVDRWNGAIVWGSGSQPAKNATYYVSYSYTVKDEVESTVEQLKPGHLKIKYIYV